MLIQYYLADGQEIRYETGDDFITLEVVNDLAMLYAEMRPNDLPEFVFMNVQLLQNFVKMFRVNPTMVPADVPQVLSIVTAVGPLQVVPKPWACDQVLILVGKHEDFDRYDLDKVFETVLKDCETE